MVVGLFLKVIDWRRWVLVLEVFFELYDWLGKIEV